jgi:hypothetical protein
MSSTAISQQDVESSDSSIRALPNDALIIRLLQATNHLSRWLTPIHDRTLLEFSPRRSEPSVKELLLRMRDTETRVYGFMNAIASDRNPDLDRIPRVEPTPVQVSVDRSAHPLVIMSEFRRVRESSTSLLRALPDTAWERGGYSRTERNWTIRELAEYLARHDREVLQHIDRVLSRSGAREGIAAVSQVDFSRIEEPFLESVSRE